MLQQRPSRSRLAGRGGLLALAVLLAWQVPAAAGSPGSEARHLIYLHGRIVQEQQDARPRHYRPSPEWVDPVVEWALAKTRP
jgi:hypothetical protein